MQSKCELMRDEDDFDHTNPDTSCECVEKSGEWALHGSVPVQGGLDCYQRACAELCERSLTGTVRGGGQARRVHRRTWATRWWAMAGAAQAGEHARRRRLTLERACASARADPTARASRSTLRWVTVVGTGA